jgi:hypothetical protein
MSSTKGYCIADTWQLYPTHCTTPTLCQEDSTITHATALLTALGSTTPATAPETASHTKAIQQLHNILLLSLYPGTTDPRLPAPPELSMPTATPTQQPDMRVIISTSPAPRVLYPTGATTSLDTNSLLNIQILLPAHQCHTHNNNLFTILENDEEPENPCQPLDNDENMANDSTVPASNCTSTTYFDPNLGQLLSSVPTNKPTTNAHSQTHPCP